MAVRVLFACSLGLCRSAWASHVYTRLGVTTRYGGLSVDAAQRVFDEDYRWANFIGVFEPGHLAEVQQHVARTRSQATAIYLPVNRLLTSEDPLFRACLAHAEQRALAAPAA